MISRLSESLAIRIKQANPDETASVEVLKFAITGLLNNSITTFCILLIGALTNHFWDICIVTIAYMLLRWFAGSYHFKSAKLCFIVSVVTISPIPILANYINDTATVILTLISLVVTAIYAPTNVKRTRIKPKHYPIYKAIALLIIGVNLIINSPLLAITFVFQTVSTIHIKEKIT